MVSTPDRKAVMRQRWDQYKLTHIKISGYVGKVEHKEIVKRAKAFARASVWAQIKATHRL